MCRSPTGRSCWRPMESSRSPTVQIGSVPLERAHGQRQRQGALAPLQAAAGRAQTRCLCSRPTPPRACTTISTRRLRPARRNPDAPAFVTFTRVRPNSVKRPSGTDDREGPNSSAAGWTSTMVERSPSQFEVLGIQRPCHLQRRQSSAPPAAGGSTSSTQMDPSNGTAWGLQRTGCRYRADWTVRAGQVE